MSEKPLLHSLADEFDGSHVSVTVADLSLPDQPLIYANPAFLRLTGYGLDDVLDHNCRFLQHGDADPNAKAELRAMLDNPKAQIGRAFLRNYRASGEPFENLVFLHRLPTRPDGSVVLGSQFDVTQARRHLSIEEAANLHSTELLSRIDRYHDNRRETARIRLQAAEMAAQTVRTITAARLRHL